MSRGYLRVSSQFRGLQRLLLFCRHLLVSKTTFVFKSVLLLLVLFALTAAVLSIVLSRVKILKELESSLIFF